MNIQCLTNKELLKFAEIYQNDVSCGIENEEERRTVRLIFADLMAVLIKFKTNYECCKNKECPNHPIDELKLLMENYKEILNKYLYPENINILNKLINENE